jgi:hypothetical protein
MLQTSLSYFSYQRPSTLTQYNTYTFGCFLVEVDVNNKAGLYISNWTRDTFFSNQFITPKHQVIFFHDIKVFHKVIFNFSLTSILTLSLILPF